MCVCVFVEDYASRSILWFVSFFAYHKANSLHFVSCYHTNIVHVKQNRTREIYEYVQDARETILQINALQDNNAGMLRKTVTSFRIGRDTRTSGEEIKARVNFLLVASLNERTNEITFELS